MTSVYVLQAASWVADKSTGLNFRRCILIFTSVVKVAWSGLVITMSAIAAGKAGRVRITGLYEVGAGINLETPIIAGMQVPEASACAVGIMVSRFVNLST